MTVDDLRQAWRDGDLSVITFADEMEARGVSRDEIASELAGTHGAWLRVLWAHRDKHAERAER